MDDCKVSPKNGISFQAALRAQYKATIEGGQVDARWMFTEVKLRYKPG